MRYFQTSNASRQYYFGGLAVSFEPIDQIGGSWLGLLAVEQNSTADIIAAALPQNPQVTEISQEEYDALKKKPLTPSASYKALPEPPSPAPLGLAALVGAGGAKTSVSVGNVVPAPVDANAPTVPAGEGVTLETRDVEIPDELRLETGAKTLRK